MPSIARHEDPCGGGKIIASATKMTVNGKPVALLLDKVADHGSGPHNSAALVTGSPKLTCEGKRVVRVGDGASCGHTVTAGSSNATA